MIFRIDLKIFIYFILFYFTGQIKLYAIIMLFAFIHEMGHLLVGLLLKMKIKRVYIMPVGFSIEFTLNEKSYSKKNPKYKRQQIKKLIVALAGPITNMFIILICMFTNVNYNVKNIIIYSNLLIGLFNLIPIYPLDGGRVLKIMLNLVLSRDKVEVYTNYISNITLFFLSICFSILIYYLKNIAFLVILIYLWYIAIRENKVYKIRIKMYHLLNNKL